MHANTSMGRSISTVLFGAMLFALAGCLTPISSGTTSATALRSDRYTTSTDQVAQASVEHAAIDALTEIRRTARSRDTRRLRVGAIVERDGRFEWKQPVRAGSDSHPVVRLDIEARHVATYIVHPRTGSTELDRLNEQMSDRYKKLVDEKDPQHRPLFVLTPSGRVLSYGVGDGGGVVELVDLRRAKSTEVATEEIVDGPDDAIEIAAQN